MMAPAKTGLTRARVGVSTSYYFKLRKQSLSLRMQSEKTSLLLRVRNYGDNK